MHILLIESTCGQVVHGAVWRAGEQLKVAESSEAGAVIEGKLNREEQEEKMKVCKQAWWFYILYLKDIFGMSRLS